VKPTPMEEIERTNTVVVRNSLQGQEGREGEMRRDPYTMDVNRGRNYYNCRGFSYIVQNCRNQRMVGQKSRIKYRDNLNTMDKLKEEENLVVFD